jgi:histone demethylase JARID1
LRPPPARPDADFEANAFREGDVYSLDDFERIASTFEREWFGGEAKAAAADAGEREAEFWRVVEDGEDEAEALYGADLDSAKVGSGFPRRGASSDPHADSPWNLTNLPRAGGAHASLAAGLAAHVPGVTAPRVSLGMLFSSFGWAVEEHALYSITYNHWGAATRWYAAPAHAAGLFEAASRGPLPDPGTALHELLAQAPPMLSPRALRARGVPVCALTQEAGAFVVTFPNAYHAGLSLGVNCGEGLALAPPDWLRFGAHALSRYRHSRRPCAFSHERLVLDLAARCAAAAAAEDEAEPMEGAEPAANGHEANGHEANGHEANGAGAAASGPAAAGSAPSGRTCYWVAKELGRVVEEERVLRAKLWSEGLRRSRRVAAPLGMRAGDRQDAACAVCHLFLHLSAVECECCPRRRACLHHAAALCGCPMRKRRLAWRLTLQELDALAAAAAARVPSALAAAIDAEEAALAEGERAALVATTSAAAAAAGAAGAAEEEALLGVKLEEALLLEAARTAAAASPPGDAAAAAVKLEETPGAAAAGAEEGDDLEGLAGFMTALAGDGGGGGGGGESGRKRKRGSASGSASPAGAALPLAASLLSPNGFVQGPVRPFAPLDVFPEDREVAGEWLASIAAGFPGWRDRAEAALDRGGPAAADVPSLLEEGEQFTWGGAGAAQAAAVLAIEPRLRAAAEYMAAVGAALRGKPAVEVVEELLSRHPKPLADPPGLDKLSEGVDAAREWLARHGALAAPGAAPVEARALEAAVGEASRLPVALPEARALRERLATARKVAEAVRTALPTSREAGRRRKDEAAVSVEELEELRAQAEGVRVQMPEAANLAAALERIEGWRARARALAGVRPPLEEVRELLEEADALPAAMEEAQALRALADKGEAWLRQAAALTRSRAALKRMRDLLHAGLRLPVETPAVEDLRLDIRRREWEDAARRAASSAKGTLHALLEVLAAAAEMGAEETELAGALRAKVAAAEAWDMGAAAFLEQRVTSEGLTEADRPSREELAVLVAEGAATGVKMERLAYLGAQLAAAGKWVARARECVPPEAQQQHQPAGGAAQDPEDGDMEEEIDIVGDASPPRPPSPPPPPPVPAAAPAQRARAAPHLEVVSSLLKEYDEALIFRAEEAPALRRLRAAADGWLAEAAPVLEQDAVTDEQLPLLARLIAGGKACGVSMEEVDILEANVEALHWGQAVRSLLAALPELPEGGEADAAAAAPAAAPAALVGGLPPPDPEPPEPEGAPPPPTTPYELRPRLARLTELLDEGGILPCDEDLFARFKRCANSCCCCPSVFARLCLPCGADLRGDFAAAWADCS